MGNSPSCREAGGAELDFSCLYIDGEAWNDAQGQASFLSKVQKSLLDPSFVSALQLSLNDEEGDWRERSQAFEKALSAGAWHASELLDTLKPRFSEDLSATLRVPPYVTTLRKRILLLQQLQQRVSGYRSAAQRPLVSQPKAPPPPSTEESSQVRLTYTMNRVCLVALNTIVKLGAAQGGGGTPLVRLPLQELHRMALSFQPQCFFAEASLPLSPPETTVDVDPSTAFATSTDANRSPDKALDDKTNSYWCSKKRPGTVSWGVMLKEPTTLSAVTVTWQQNFNSVFAPLELHVQASKDGEAYEEVARLDMENLTSAQAAAPLRVSAAAEGVRFVRLQMTGYARYNDQGYYGLKSVVVHKVKPDPEYLDVREVLQQLQEWLITVSKEVPDLSSTALSAMERVASSSGLLSCVLHFVFSLLRPPLLLQQEEEEDGTSLDGAPLPPLPPPPPLVAPPPLPPTDSMLVEATKHLLKCITDEDRSARGKLAQAVSSPMTPVMNACFDAYEMSSSGLSLSDDNMHVRCHTASHSHVYVNCGFREGKWAWEFLVAEDITNDESICVGAGVKPVTSSSYNSSPNLWMYRCYNGNLYRKGGQISGVSKERIHPNDVVRIELDHDAHTLSYRINGDKDQGVCFTDVTGEVFPAVAFYGANRAVRLIAVECSGVAGAGMRYYLASDVYKRRKWEGEMACGLRHGYGKLTYTHTTAYWLGTWKQDKQHGLQAWVVADPVTGKPLLPPELYLFECDVKKRPATDKDLAAAAKDWDGWICSACAFVSRRTSEFCGLCGAVRAVQDKKEADSEEVLDTREACCAAIMSRLASLGALYNSPVGEEASMRRLSGCVEAVQGCVAGGGKDACGGGGKGPSSCPNPSCGVGGGQTKDLTLPFCTEPRLEVFRLLHEMVLRHCDRLDREDEFRIVLGSLRLIRTNLDRLVSSHVNPADVGIHVTTSPDPSLPMEQDTSLYTLRVCLERLMAEATCHPDVGQAAAEALAAGMEILYPDTKIRCNLLCHLLRSHIDVQFSSSSLGQSTLLDRLLRRFGTNEGVVALLPTEAGASSQHEETSLLLEYLFKALHMEKSRELDDHLRGRCFPASPSSEPAEAAEEDLLTDDRLSFSDSISVLLSAYLRQLLSFAGSTSPDGSEPCSRMLVHLGMMVLKYCHKLIWTVSNHISSGSLSTTQAETFLRGSVVFHLLPLFATATFLLSDLLWFASRLIPHVVRVIRSLDELNSLLPEVVEADKELRLQERAMTHNRWVSKKKNEINAVFDAKDHSEDVSIEDGGKLFRSTSSSNQHALVGVGFRTGKAAWEFKLESDSSNDECSALGAAVKPVLSSSYESCPNMWMRRSYNGQLYHGTSSGYSAMSKVHPGDVLRIEVDLDAHTMSFKKNGEDEGVAFTDIEGEVFPAVCTYRSGIEIRLLKVEHWHGNASSFHNQNPLSLLFDSTSLPGYVRVDEYDNSFMHNDKERDEKWATVVTTRGISSGRHMWEFCIRRCSKAMIAVGICSHPDAGLAKDQLGLHKNAWAWRVDGTLWAHGRQCSSSYGVIKAQHLLTDGDVVTVTLDVHAQTLAFSVNGKDLGLAFGPPGSGAEAEVPVVNGDPFRVFFPAVSLHNYHDKVRIRPAGTMGTLALPWLLDLEKTLMAVGSRLSSTVTAGPKFSPEEQRLERWMSSPLFVHGVQQQAADLLGSGGHSNKQPSSLLLIQRFVTGGQADGRDVMDHWDIGDEELYLLGSPEKRSSKQRRAKAAATTANASSSPMASQASKRGGVGLSETLSFGEEAEEAVLVEAATSASGGLDFNNAPTPSPLSPASPRLKDFDRLLEAILPASSSSLPSHDDEPSGVKPPAASPSKAFQAVQRWLDPLGSSRITRRLCESYPVVVQCEAYAMAAFLKVTGLWRDALRVVDGHSVPSPATAQARMVGKKMQELRLGLLKQHQKMKEEEAAAAAEERSGSGVGEEESGVAAQSESSVPMAVTTTSDSSVFGSSPLAYGLLQQLSAQAPILGAGTPVERVSLTSTVELDLSAALLERTDSGMATPLAGQPPLDPNPLPPRAPDFRRRVSTGPHVSSFLQVCHSLRDKARFLLEFSAPPPIPPPTPSSTATTPMGLGASSSSQLHLSGSGYTDSESVDPSSPSTTPSSLSSPSASSAFDSLLQSCADFLSDQAQLSVPELRAVFERRLGRALCRRYGLRCYRALLMASAYSSVQVHAIRNIKAALSTRQLLLPSGAKDATEASTAGSSDAADSASATPSASPLAGSTSTTASTQGNSSDAGAVGEEREGGVPGSGGDSCHYLKGLEGCSEAVTRGVRQDFASLYSFLLSLLKRALLDKNVTLACHILSAWSLDFQPADSDFLLDLRILKNIRSILSLSRLSRCISAGLVITESHGLHWTAWPIEDVRNGLAQGRITKRIILEHMRSAPQHTVPRSWWQSVGLSPEAGDVDLIVSRLRIGDVITLYEGMLRYVTEQQKRDKAKLALADRLARDEARKKRGVRYTYIVTATNGVGVRHLPDTRAERTGHSFKQHEIVEASYRHTLANRQTYIKLVDGGWVFDIGVRGSYKDKPIMKCIATEAYVDEEEANRSLRAAMGRLLVANPGTGSGASSGGDAAEVSSDGLAAYYKDLSSEALALLQSTVRMPIIPPATATAHQHKTRHPPLSSSSSAAPRCNYYELTIHSTGGRQDICLGLTRNEGEEVDEMPPGLARGTVGLHTHDWSLWADGSRVPPAGVLRSKDHTTRRAMASPAEEAEPMMMRREVVEEARAAVGLQEEEEVKGLAGSGGQPGVLLPSLKRQASDVTALLVQLEGDFSAEDIGSEASASASSLPLLLQHVGENTTSDMASALGLMLAEGAEAGSEAKATAMLQHDDSKAAGDGLDASSSTSTSSSSRSLEVVNDADDKIGHRLMLPHPLGSPSVLSAARLARSMVLHGPGLEDDSAAAKPSAVAEDVTHFLGPLKDGDVVGCGIDYQAQKVFFTFNGKRMPADVDLSLLVGEEAVVLAPEQHVVPLFSLKSHCEIAEANMGPSFLYEGPEVCGPAAKASAAASSSLSSSSSFSSFKPRPKPAETPRRHSPLGGSLAGWGSSSSSSFWDVVPSPRGPASHGLGFHHGDPLLGSSRSVSSSSSYSLDMGQQEDDFLAKEGGHDFACGLTVPEMDALHVTAWPLLQLLIIQGVHFSTPPASSSSPWGAAAGTGAAALQLRDSCFELITEQLRMCADVLMGRKGEDGAVCGAEPVKVEAMAFRYLLLLLPLVDRMPRSPDSHPAFLSCILSLLVCGSPRIQRLVLRLLRHALAGTSPRLADDVLRRFFKPASSAGREGVRFVRWMLERASTVLAKASGLPSLPSDESALGRMPFRLGVFATSAGSGSGHAHMSLLCEEACLLRSLMSDDTWRPEVLGTMLQALRDGAKTLHEAAGSRRSSPRPTSPAFSPSSSMGSSPGASQLLVSLAALFVLSDTDTLRVGGVVERAGGGGSEERYTVVDYRRGAGEVLVLDSAGGKDAGGTPLTLPMSALAQGSSLVAVPEVSTPRLPEDMAQALLQELHRVLQGCHVAEPVLSSSRRLGTVWSGLRTLAVASLRTLLMHFRHPWTEPLIPHVSSVLFHHALRSVALPFCPATPRLEGKLQVVQERMYEAACLGPAYLTSMDPSLRASTLREADDDCRLYRVVLKDGAVVREGVSIELSERVKVLKVGTVVEVLEQCVAPPEGITRFRIKDGWISERCHGGTEDLIMERVSKAMSDDVLLRLPPSPSGSSSSTGPLPPVTANPASLLLQVGGERAIKHRLHDSALRLVTPSQLFPDAASWECDHCTVSFPPDEPGFAGTGTSRTWLLCLNCFRSDPRAVAVALGGPLPPARSTPPGGSDSPDPMDTRVDASSRRGGDESGGSSSSGRMTSRSASTSGGMGVMRRRSVGMSAGGSGSSSGVPPAPRLFDDSSLRGATEDLGRDGAVTPPYAGTVSAAPTPLALPPGLAPSSAHDSHLTAMAMTQLTEMGFPREHVRTALSAALPATGSLAMDGLEQVIEQTIEYLTSGTMPPMPMDDAPADTSAAAEAGAMVVDEEEEDDEEDELDDDTESDSSEEDDDFEAKTASRRSQPRAGSGRLSSSSALSSAAESKDGRQQEEAAVEALPLIPEGLAPVQWSDSDADKLRKINGLARITAFPRSICRCALEMSSGSVPEARAWIEYHGMKYLPSAGKDHPLYPAVFTSLGFLANLPQAPALRVHTGAPHTAPPGSSSLDGSGSAMQQQQQVVAELEGVEEGAIMQKLTARLGAGEAEECLLYEATGGGHGRAGGPGSGERSSEAGGGSGRSEHPELLFEEAICESLEFERTSKVHKMVVALVCTRCQYLEFPGCSTHSQLLSVRKPNGNGKCARCSCATDVHSPWDKGCRVCRKPTKKCFWAMTVRETQFLLRAFPSHCRQSNDDTCEMYVLRCPECSAVGFPGIGGSHPLLCTRSKQGPYTVALDVGGSQSGLALPVDTWAPHLLHVGACPAAGKPVEELLVRVSFSEAKYLYKTAANVETYARYVIRAKGLKEGALLAITDEDGPLAQLVGRIGTVRLPGLAGQQQQQQATPPSPRQPPSSLAMQQQQQQQQSVCEEQVSVDLLDEERGLLIPHTVKTSQARIVTHMYGHALGSRGDTTMRQLAMATHDMLTSRYAREAIVWMMSHWSPQHPPTCASLGILTWQPFIQVFKLVGLSDHSFTAGHGSRSSSGDLGPASLLPSSAVDVLQSGTAALSSSPRSASLASVLKKQVTVWLRTLGSVGEDGEGAMMLGGRASPRMLVQQHDPQQLEDHQSLFHALLHDSLHNLYSIALGQALPLTMLPPLPPVLSRVPSLSVADLTPASAGGTSRTVAVRQSLHPFFGPCCYAEQIRIPGAQSLRVTLDARSAFGSRDEAVLCFWRNEEEARAGKRPIKRLPSKPPNGSSPQAPVANSLSFVVPNSDTAYYTFESRDDRCQRLPAKLELEATNFCRDDFTVDKGVVRCTGGFPSVAPKDVSLTSGKWYYEVTLVKAGLAQLGWGDTVFTGNSVKGEGVGDDMHSWGLDGHRVYKWHGGGVRWGRAWSDDDVVGFTADLEKRCLGFSLNGSFDSPMGQAFEDVSFLEGIRPCLTLNKSCSFRVNFGELPFKHGPPPGFRPIIEAPRAHVLKKQYWGYRFEVAACLGLQTRPVSDFKPMWKSWSPGAGGNAGEATTIWRPKVWPGCAMLGDIAVSGSERPDATLVVVDDDSPLLAYPVSYTRVLTLDAANETNGCIWRPVPPEGYVAMGDVFALGYTEPSPSLVRCIRRDAVESAPLYRRIRVWREPKVLQSEAEALRHKNMTLWAVGNQLRSFVVAEGFGTPLSDGLSAQGWAIKGALPGTLQQAWQSEGGASGQQPSMEWALWVLDCFLENCNTPELLYGGILSPQTFEALIKCIVDAHCTDRTRTPAASLLSRLLRTRRMRAHHHLTLPPHLLPSDSMADLPFSVRALGKITHELFKFCRERLHSGRLFLQKDLQQMVELVTTINWMTPQQRSHGGSLDMGSSGDMSKAALLASGSLHSSSSSLSSSGGGGGGSMLLQLRKAAKGERSSDEEVMVNLMAMTEFFFLDKAAATAAGAGAEALPVCCTSLRAWLDSVACLQIVESDHPMPRPATTPADARRAEGSMLVVLAEGEVSVDGAESLEVMFDKRCALPDGHALVLTGLDMRAAPTASPSSSEWLDGQLVVRLTSTDGAPWENKLQFRGNSMRWRLEARPSESVVSEQQQEEEGETKDEAAAADRLSLAPQPARLPLLGTSVSFIPPRLQATGSPAGSSSEWGYCFTVVGRKISPGMRLRRLMQHLSETDVLAVFPASWAVENDVAIVEWLNARAESLGKEAVDLSPLDYSHGSSAGSSTCSMQLEDVPLALIYLRIALIQGFNRNLRQVLPLIEIGSGCRHSLGNKLRGLSHLVFRDVKMGLIEAAKERTQGSGGNSLTITLDNFSASRSIEANERDIRTSRCIFVQAFRALHHKDTKLLRSCWDGDRVFQVTFRGENGSDAGGVFREGMSRVVEDLFSDTLNLLIPCPNAMHGLPNNVDKFIPNPKLSCCHLALDMCEFVGKLMGVSMRANLCLPFQFPSLVWKRLLGQELTVKDMEAVDTLTCKLLDSVRSCVDEEDFNEKFGSSLTFVCTGWDGSEMELFPGGSSEFVQHETRVQFCDLLQDYRLHEFDAQIASVARGLYAIVPRDTLLLLTWHEFEVLVCGSPSFDLEFWRRHTTYSGYTEDDPTVHLFWKVLESLTQEEQSGFVRFAWGRSRLPPKNAWFKDMQISRRNTSEDSLPASHTCFFSIELPPYRSEAAMRKGLLTAIHFGMVGILNT